MEGTNCGNMSLNINFYNLIDYLDTGAKGYYFIA